MGVYLSQFFIKNIQNKNGNNHTFIQLDDLINETII
jgi:hypothetical protein